MSDERVIPAKITRNGMRDVFAANNAGLSLKLSHLAIGTGGGTGYQPTGDETTLRSEFSRVAIGGGDYLTDFEILVQALFDGAPQGWIHEVGIFTDTGRLFALWSEVNAPLAYKTSGVATIIALTLALSEIPPNSVTLVVGGANVNISIAGPFAGLAAELIRLQNRALQVDTDRYTAQINATWY